MASGRATATLQADSAQCPAPRRRPASGHCSHTRGASCPEGIPIRCKLSCARATPSPGNWQPTRMPSTARRSGSRPEPLHAVTRRIQPMPGWGGAQVNRFRPAARLWGTLENPELGLRPFEPSCVVPERNCHADSRMQLADQPRRHGTRYCSAAFNIRQSIRTGRSQSRTFEKSRLLAASHRETSARQDAPLRRAAILMIGKRPLRLPLCLSLRPSY